MITLKFSMIQFACIFSSKPWRLTSRILMTGMWTNWINLDQNESYALKYVIFKLYLRQKKTKMIKLSAPPLTGWDLRAITYTDCQSVIFRIKTDDNHEFEHCQLLIAICKFRMSFCSVMLVCRWFSYPCAFVDIHVTKSRLERWPALV